MKGIENKIENLKMKIIRLKRKRGRQAERNKERDANKKEDFGRT